MGKKAKRAAKLEKKTLKSAKPVSRAVRRYERPRNLNGGPITTGSGRYERIPHALADLRSSCSHLVHTNPHAAAAIRIWTTHTVGSGIRAAFSKVAGAAAYDADHYAWANSTDCDYEGRLNLYGIQYVAVRCQREKGEAFIVVHDGKAENDYRPKFQVIDPDVLDPSATPKYKGNSVFDGIEVRKSGQIVGYHLLFVDHQGVQEKVFVYADHMIHLMEVEMPGQMRGIPSGVTVLMRAQIHDAFFQAVLTKAHSDACFGLAFKKGPRPDEEADMGGALSQLADDTEDDGYGSAYPRPAGLTPGMMIELDYDEEVQVINPASMGGYDSFVKLSREDIATGYGVPYAWLTSDASRSNYGNSKAVNVDFYTRVDAFRSNFLYPALFRMERIYRDAYELRTGANLDGMDVKLIAPKRIALEPAKEALEMATLLVTGGITWRDYIYLQGKDPDVQRAELKRERAELAEDGIVLKFGTELVGHLSEAVAAIEHNEAAEKKSSEDDASGD